MLFRSTTHKVIVSANNHGLAIGNNVYLFYTSGDQANGINAYYTVSDVSVINGTNTFNVVSANILTHASNVTVYTDKVTLYRDAAETFTYSNGNTAYVSFVSGDQANSSNLVYTPTKIAANVLRIGVEYPPTVGGNARLWYSSNNYSNVLFTRADHGFVANDNVWVEFFTSSADLANGLYMVSKSFGANTYNIHYNANTYIDTTSNTIVYSGAGVTTNSVMEGASSVALYK